MAVRIFILPHTTDLQRFDQRDWEWVNRPFICTLPANIPLPGVGFGDEIFGAGTTEADAIADAEDTLGPVTLETKPCGRGMIEILSKFGGDPTDWPLNLKWEVDNVNVARLKG